MSEKPSGSIFIDAARVLLEEIKMEEFHPIYRIQIQELIEEREKDIREWALAHIDFVKSSYGRE